MCFCPHAPAGGPGQCEAFTETLLMFFPVELAALCSTLTPHTCRALAAHLSAHSGMTRLD